MDVGEWMRRSRIAIAVVAGALLSLAGCGGGGPRQPVDYSGPTAEWSVTGGAEGGGHFSPLTQITPANVSGLKQAWTYHIGLMTNAPEMSSPTFEATPIVADGKMFVCSGLGRIVALDPTTGKQVWAFDQKADPKGTYLLNCRGVTYYHDARAAPGTACANRIFSGTIDGKLIALDAATGRPCADFGADGRLNLLEGLGKTQLGDLAISSAPVIADDLVIVGGRIPDNMRTDVPAGVVRAFDVHTGKLVWAWNPLPPGRSDKEVATEGEPYIRATPNVWAPMAVDAARHMLFLPTGNAAPDHVGITRHGLDYLSSSVGALDTRTGQMKWHFQTVHHDLWDYDVPSQPVLFDLERGGRKIPALAQSTKVGHIFILDRETGQPLFPVVEKPVPQTGGLPGEKLSPTQPFPANPAFIVRRDLSEKDIWGFTPWDRGKCREMFRNADWKGVFTPPSTRGVITFPSFMGATNWGGVAIDQASQVMIVNTTQVPAIVTMVPRKAADARMAKGEMMLPAIGAPYANTMQPMLSPLGAPCISPPWGTLLAIDLKTGKRLWEEPLGTTRDVAPFPLWFKWGVPNLGGSVVTASGLVFIGATTDNYLRAFDIRTGKLLWKGRLPGGGQATPMTFRLAKDGKQYVVIAAGGHKYLGTKVSDALVAFALEG